MEPNHCETVSGSGMGDTLETQDFLVEQNFSKKTLIIQCSPTIQALSSDHIISLRKVWTEKLKSWHSPYTCLLDFTNVSLSLATQTELKKIFAFFKNFHMRKLALVGSEIDTHALVDSYIVQYRSREEAASAMQLDELGPQRAEGTDLRSSIVIENDFNNHVMELSFNAVVVLTNASDVKILQSKLTNILKMWHSPFSVLINCSNFSILPDAVPAFESLQRFLKNFFCKEILGYSPKEAKECYPFVTFRSRHQAAGKLSHEGLLSGDKANCGPLKSVKP